MQYLLVHAYEIDTYPLLLNKHEFGIIIEIAQDVSLLQLILMRVFCFLSDDTAGTLSKFSYIDPHLDQLL